MPIPAGNPLDPWHLGRRSLARRTGGPNNDKVLEALNALAVVAATLIAGPRSREGRAPAAGGGARPGQRQQTRKFFNTALAQQVADLIRHPP